MEFKEIKAFYKEKFNVLRECDFDGVHLLGKPRVVKHAVSYLTSIEFVKDFFKEKVTGVICTEDIADLISDNYSGGICVTKEPRKMFWEIHNFLAKKSENIRKTVIAKSAKVSSTSSISPIGVTIGEGVVIMDNVIIKENTFIGEKSTIHENAIIGTPGFYYFGESDNKKLVYSSGGVKIGKNVEIHPNTVIQKSVLGRNTYIGDNTKIDMNCCIGHDAKIAKDCIIAAGSTIAAGNTVGRNTFIGINTITVPNMSIGSNVKTSVGTIIGKHVPDDVQVINLKMYDVKHIITKKK